MENINFNMVDLVSIAGGLGVIVGSVVAIVKWYKTHFSDRFENIEERLETIETMEKNYRIELKDSKDERLILLEAVLACLKGLQEQGIDGPVTKGIEKVEKYMMEKTHK